MAEEVAKREKNNVPANLRNARNIVKWMEKNNTTRPPRRHAKLPEEKKLGCALGSIRQYLIKPYIELGTEEEREEYRKKHPEIDEVMEIVENIDKNNIPTNLRNTRKIVGWMEKNNTTRPPSQVGKTEEEKRLGELLSRIRQDLIKPYIELKTEKERKEYRKRHPEIGKVMRIVNKIDKNNIPTHLRNARQIVEWIDENNRMPRARGIGEERRLAKALSSIKYYLIKPYKKLETEEEREEYRKKHPEIDEVMKIVENINKNKMSISLENEIKEFLEKEEKNNVPTNLRNARKIVKWMEMNNTTKPPKKRGRTVEERKLANALSSIRQNLIKRYEKLETEQKREEYRKKHPEIDEVMEIVEIIDKNNIPTNLRNTRKIVGWMEKNSTTRPPSQVGKTEEERRLSVLLSHLRQDLIKPYENLQTEEERVEYRKKHPEINEVKEIIEKIDKNNIRVYLRNAKEVVKWIDENGRMPRVRGVGEEKRLAKALSSIKYYLIKPYTKLKTEKEREEFREKHPEIDEVMKILLEKKLIASDEKQNALTDLVNQDKEKRETLEQARKLEKQYKGTKNKKQKEIEGDNIGE